jgi:hypothetical protein
MTESQAQAAAARLESSLDIQPFVVRDDT